MKFIRRIWNILLIFTLLWHFMCPVPNTFITQIDNLKFTKYSTVQIGPTPFSLVLKLPQLLFENHTSFHKRDINNSFVDIMFNVHNSHCKTGHYQAAAWPNCCQWYISNMVCPLNPNLILENCCTLPTPHCFARGSWGKIRWN